MFPNFGRWQKIEFEKFQILVIFLNWSVGGQKVFVYPYICWIFCVKYLLYNNTVGKYILYNNNIGKYQTL